MLVSCYKPYDPRIVANDTILAVDGMITNEFASYRINLSYALPFDSENKFGLPVNSARVYVNDDLGNSFSFRQVKTGSYKSDSLRFRGHPGRSYTLFIETSDGETFMSDPQQLLPEFTQDSVYAETEYKQTLGRYNRLVTSVHGANILVDIKSVTDTLPHFRFTSNLVNQYFYALQIPPSDRSPFYYFYCWQTENVNPDINLVHKEYSSNSSSISKHEVYFVDDQIFIDGIVYGLGQKNPDLSYTSVASSSHQTYTISHRILYLNQYTLNNEAFRYYKSMDELIRSEGKLFDPIAVQLIGNVRCTSNPNKKTFGFFEASSVSRASYLVGFRNAHNDQYLVTRTPYIPLKMPYGCLINKAPSFWVY
jgi:hypothetical protein